MVAAMYMTGLQKDGGLCHATPPGAWTQASAMTAAGGFAIIAH
jgi:hypothetical protein